MKKVIPLIFVLFMLAGLAVRPAEAQTDTPPTPTPTGPVGEVRGTITDHNTGKLITESLDVMLHVLDANYADIDMVHGQSQGDGSYVFSSVAFDTSRNFAVMATFDGVTYYSDAAPADMKSLQVNLDVPVYETTKDITTVQVDQMHVLFNVTEDGMETKELYILSNLGERTVKDAFDLGDSKLAAMKYPLPKDADYIFFQPDDKDRFVKQDSAFADTYPLLPGSQSSQVMVSYLVPFSGKRTYSYTAPVNIARINFVLPADANFSLLGSNLSGPNVSTLQDNKTYMVYSYADLKAGQTLELTLSGTPVTPETNTNKKTNNLLATGAGLLGLTVLGGGLWWWRKSNQEQEEERDAPESESSTFDDLITEIALLDETYQQKGLSVEQYQQQRHELLQKAKQLSELEEMK